MEEQVVIVTGANGQLGSEFRRLSAAFPQFSFVFAAKNDLDTTVESWIGKFLHQHKPAAVINCAAYTNVERAEDEIEPAMLANASAPGFVAEACHQHEVLLVHISTDYVFDGNKSKPYSETDHPLPLNIYGESKLEGERQVDEKTQKQFTIRTSWLYSAFGHNFFKTMLRLAKERGELNVVNDQVASPTYAGDLAMDILRLLDKVLVRQEHVDYGLYHYSHEGEASWFDFASEIVRQAHLSVPVHPVNSGSFPTKARRPVFSKLDCTKWKQNTGFEIPDWKDGLKRCFTEFKQLQP